MVKEGSAAIRVLVIDDVPDLRWLVRDTLEADSSFQVVGEAGDGSEGVDLAQRLKPDLILLDVAMPGMDGVAALPLLREVAPTTKIVVLTGLASGPLEREMRARGAVGFLAKGIPARALVSELRMVCGLLAAVEVALEEVRTALPRDPRSAAAARATVRDALRGWTIENDAIDEVALLVSELVTNAILHGQEDVEVAVRLLPDAVRVEVADSGRVLPLRSTDADESGRGLAIVEALAHRWGVEPRPEGKVVWFEVPRSGVTVDETLIQ